jgi:IS66 Orf2 like protein
MIPIPSGARVWLVTGHTDMRKGFGGLALIVQETLRRDPHLCVGRDYVAAASREAAFPRLRSLPPPHNYMLSSSCSTLSFVLNRAGCLPEIAAWWSPRRIISTSAAA